HGAGADNAADVRRDNHKVFETLLLDVFEQNWRDNIYATPVLLEDIEKQRFHKVFETLLLDVFEQNWRGIDIVYRDVEEALNLVCVQVYSQYTIHADAGNHVGYYLGADGNTGRANATVLTGVSVIGDNGGDPCGG